MTRGQREASERIDEVAQLVRERLDDEQADTLVRFTRHYYQAVPAHDLLDTSVEDLYGAALAHWSLAREREPGTALVRAYTPELETHGWQSTHSSVEIVTDDMPFLVDSVTMALTRNDRGIHLVIHPIVSVVRDDAGRLVDVTDPDAAEAQRESFIRVEFDRETDAEALGAIEQDLHDVLADVRVAVADWKPMLQRVRDILDRLEESPPPVDDETLEEARAFLRWVHDDHFTFLGYREYELVGEGDDTVLRSVPETGLGLLRQPGGEASTTAFSELPPEARKLAREPSLLMLTKANSKATVHRPAYLDYIGLKVFDDQGEVVGERRFIGLYTSAAYHMTPMRIPILRRKVDQVLERSGFRPDSHNGKDLVAILETYPRDELFQTPVDELFDIVMGIHHLQERRQVRLFVRRDIYGRFYSCLVFLPRNRYNTTSRKRIQRILMDELDGTELDYGTRVSESVLARLHFTIRTATAEPVDHDPDELERRIADATRTWAEELEEALTSQVGEEHGVELLHRYAEAFPPGYQDDMSARLAVRDIERLEQLAHEDRAMDLRLYRPLESPTDTVRLKLYLRDEPITLSEALPILENLGVRVIDQRPYEVGTPERTCWIFDFGLDVSAIGEFDLDGIRGTFHAAFHNIWDGHAEDDAFNQLVLAAELSWRDVSLLRAYARYLQQVGTQFSQTYMADTLTSNRDVSRSLVELFHDRFEPGRDVDGSASDERREDLARRIDAVESLDEDRILRSFLNLITATLRTNFFQTEQDGSPRPHLSVKLDPKTIPDLPLPRPMFEIWVYSPRMEGVHLRSGNVARGGIRWSDRREDFRTEILGLMKAQQVKNAVIVPMGAKGGFVVKHLPDGDRDAVRDEVVACYRTLMEGMLDITDNLVGGEVVSPDQVVRYDGDDPYLVVAADKGTATFSDIANGIAEEYGFWLRDAFASGGSAGYDHKAMGITARGAWESVKRHFRELGTDPQTTDVTVVGIGDMSGDVFGNGMLLSEHIRLVAAFDHRHIFLDPDPDAARSFEERRRLFELPRSSWDDYDRDALSEGGGVHPRTAKSIALTPQVRERLGIDAGALTPDEVIRAILRAPVDLLWNGGIGTYIKASSESHAEVGDKTNDRVRVDGRDLRCRVVGEGGNLGVTQLGRIEFALQGGRINTDAIDNSAGVDCSDHEVNIKILLNQVLDAGDLTRKQRDELLAAMTDEVAELVLRDNVAQNQALSLAVANAHSMVEVHRRYIRFLENEDLLDRQLEALPDDEIITDRRNQDGGLTRPEFAVLLAYTKNWLYAELLGSDVPDDPYLTHLLVEYFPTELRERYRDRMDDHRLRRELVATVVTNELVNESGSTFVFRLSEETGATASDIARAQLVARELFDLRELWSHVDQLDHEVDASVQTRLLLEGRRLTERASRWLLRQRPRPLDIGDTIQELTKAKDTVAGMLPDPLVGLDREAYDQELRAFLDEGVPEELARRTAAFEPLFSVLDIADAWRATREPVEEVASVYFLLGERLELSWVRARIVALSRQSRWDTLARDALRDDLYGLHRDLTVQVLDRTDADATADERITSWMEHHPGAVDRCQQVVTDIRASGSDSVTTLTVALRELRNLAGATGA